MLTATWDDPHNDFMLRAYREARGTGAPMALAATQRADPMGAPPISVVKDARKQQEQLKRAWQLRAAGPRR
jgi:hypothetical protein